MARGLGIVWLVSIFISMATSVSAGDRNVMVYIFNVSNNFSVKYNGNSKGKIKGWSLLTAELVYDRPKGNKDFCRLYQKSSIRGVE